jgi:hypothetical protein
LTAAEFISVFHQDGVARAQELNERRHELCGRLVRETAEQISAELSRML